MDDTEPNRGGGSVVSDRLSINIDTDEIAEAMARAGRDRLSDAIRSSGPQASASTLKARRRAGVSGDRSFYATGRLASGLELIRNGDGSYDVVAPPGYLQDERLIAKFQEQILTEALDRALSVGSEAVIESETRDIIKVESRGH